MQSLVNGSLGIEGKSSIDFGGNLSRDNSQNLLSELDQETVKGRVDLLIDGRAVLLAILNRNIDQLGIFRLLCSSKNERRVGGGILGLVFANC